MAFPEADDIGGANEAVLSNIIYGVACESLNICFKIIIEICL